VSLFALVAVVSGRRTEEVSGLVAVEGVRYIGLYGMEQGQVDEIVAVRQAVEAAARTVPGAWVEAKGISLAVHYRQAPDPATARRTLSDRLADLVAGTGLEVIEGKMVLEVVPTGERRKGGAVERLVAESGVRAALYAGDDVADLEAFRALDRLAEGGLVAVKVAVSGAESPQELLEAADLTVEGPPGLVALLRELA
jgi:trehalose 6-phosphate phosphatase